RRQQRQLQSKPIAEVLAAWADGTMRQLSQVRARPVLSLYAGALDRAGALLRRRPLGSRQQSRRTRSALRRHWPKELPAGSDAGRSAGIPVYLEIRYRFFCNTRLVVSKYRRATQSNWNRKASTKLAIRVLFAAAFT